MTQPSQEMLFFPNKVKINYVQTQIHAAATEKDKTNKEVIIVMYQEGECFYLLKLQGCI
jgi:hypothetical protein